MARRRAFFLVEVVVLVLRLGPPGDGAAVSKLVKAAASSAGSGTTSATAWACTEQLIRKVQERTVRCEVAGAWIRRLLLFGHEAESFSQDMYVRGLAPVPEFLALRCPAAGT